MSTTTTAAPSSTLLGHPQSALALRIQGTDRHGQVVRLHSPKVAIGSARNCTLRLRAPGVAPWHCLIVRGGDHTVVRRWHADTRLNDGPFEDALLRPGDRLSVGPVEFEVLEDDAVNESAAELPAASAKPNSDALAQLETDRRALEEERTHCRELRAQDVQYFLDQRSQLEEQSRQLTADRMSLSAEREAIQIERQLLLDREEKLAIRLKEVETDQAERLAAHQLREDNLEQRTTELDSRLVGLNEREADLLRRQQEFDARESALDPSKSTPAQQQEIENALAQLKSEQEAHEVTRGELAALRQSWNSDQQAWQSKQQAWEAERNTWEAERQAWATERQTLVTAVETAKLQNAASLSELDQRLTELNRQQGKLNEQQQVLAEQHNELQTEKQSLADCRLKWESEIQQQRGEIDRLKAELAAETNSFNSECDRREKELVNRTETLDRQSADLEREVARLAEERSALEAERQQFEQNLAVAKANISANEPAQSLPEIRIGTAESETPPTAQDCTPQADDPAEPAGKGKDEDDVFTRLRTLAILKDEGDDKQQERPQTETEAKSPTGEIQVGEECTAESHPADKEEESIDDYMSRLLQRMRGTTGESESLAKQASSAATDRASVPVEGCESRVESPASPLSPDEPTQKKNVQLEPRNLAPEKTHHLAAMREIANLTARTAIAAHQLRHGSNRAWKNLLLAIVGLACGVWLLATAGATKSPRFFGGVVGIIVAVYWFFRSGLLARSVLRFKQHHQKHLAAIAVESSPKDDATDVLPPPAA